MAEAAPPLEWSGRGSRLLGALGRVTEACRSSGPTARALDGTVARLAARPLALAGAAAVGVPLARLLLPGAAALPVSLALAAAAGTALLLAAAAALHEGDEGRIAARALLAGIVLRGILGAAIAAVGGFPDERGYYDLLARDSAACWSAGADSMLPWHPLTENRQAYFGLLSGAYLLGGSDIATGRLLGVLVGAGAALVAGEIARPLGGRRAAALAVALLALHPEHALWNATLSRDGLSTLLLLLAVAVLLRPPGGLLRLRTLLAAGPLALLAFNSRPTFLAAGAGILVAAVILDFARSRESAAAAIRAGLAAAAVGAAALLAWRSVGLHLTPDGIGRIRNGLVEADGARVAADFLPGLRLDGWAGVAAYAPAGALFALLAPWPWDAVHVHRAAYAALAIPGIAISILGLVGLGASLRRSPRTAAIPAAAAASLLLVLALLEGNSGILVRHRLPLTALLAVGAALLFAGLRRDAPATGAGPSAPSRGSP